MHLVQQICVSASACSGHTITTYLFELLTNGVIIGVLAIRKVGQILVM